MLNHADIILKDNRFLITGNLNFSNVMSVYDKSVAALKKSPEFIFDFSELKSSNSAALALLIEWVKLAKQYQKPYQFLHLPAEIKSIAVAGGICHLLDAS